MPPSRRVYSLLCLVLQNAGLILLTKYSFRSSAAVYSKASVVLFSEILKLASCFCMELHYSRYSMKALRKSLRLTTGNVGMLLPATLYVVQNVLQLLAIRGLSPTVYITGAQLKVVTSAVFSVFVLKKQLNSRQVASFFPLMSGVALVNLDSTERHKAASEVYAMIYLLVAVTVSGLAGVILELSFKSEDESLWSKNFFLSLFSLPMASFAVFHEVGKDPAPKALAAGYDTTVILIIVFLALGGLLSALVMKYAGTLTKCYAVAVSIVLCSVVSTLRGMQTWSYNTFGGSLLVISSVFLYAYEPKKVLNPKAIHGKG